MQNIIRILIMQALNLLFNLLRRITKKRINYYGGFYETDMHLQLETLNHYSSLSTIAFVKAGLSILNFPLSY